MAWMRPAWALLLLAASMLPPAHAIEVRPLAWTPGPGSAQPSLVATEGGDAVLTWQQREGNEARLRVARVAAVAPDADEGVTVLPDVGRGEGWFVNWADFPSLAVLDNGDWVSFTLRKSPASSYAYDIHLQRSTDGGGRWSAPVKVNDDGQPVQHGFVSLLPDGGDRVLMVWLDGRTEGGQAGAVHAGHAAEGHHDEGAMTLRSAVVGRDGVPREGAKLDADTCSCCQTDLVRRSGEVLAVYRDHAEGIRDIASVRRGPDGRWQAPETVHADRWRMPGCPVNGPAAAVQANVLAVAWPTMATGPLQVKIALSPRAGAPFAAPVVVDAGAQVLGRVDLIPWGDAGFLLSWVGSEGGAAVLRVVAIDREGRPGVPTEVTRLPPGRQLGHPRMAAVDGGAVLAWTEPLPTGPRVRLARLQP